MVIYLFEMFGASLALTVAVELVVAYFFLRLPSVRGKGDADAGNCRGEQRSAVNAEETRGEQKSAANAEENRGEQESAVNAEEARGEQESVVHVEDAHREQESAGVTGENQGKKPPAANAKGSRERKRAPDTGKKWKAWVLLVVLINMLTNPPAVLICWLGRMYLPPLLSFPMQIAVETAVVVTEAYVYRSFAGKPEWEIKSPALLSAAANGCSWLVGMLLMAWR